MKKTIKLFITVLTASVICFAGVAAAQEAAPVRVAESAEEVFKPLGKEAEGAKQLTIANKTGRNITFFSIEEFSNTYDSKALVIRIQQALINQGYLDGEADGEYGPLSKQAVADFREANKLSADGDIDSEMLTLLFDEFEDGNLLEEKDVFTAGERRTLYYAETKKEAEKEQAPESDDAAAIKEALEGTEFEANYIINVKFEDDGEVYTLHVFYFDDIADAELTVKDGILCVDYRKKDAAPNSTYEAERLIAGKLNSPYISDYDYYEDDGPHYDGGCIEEGILN